MRGRRTRWWTRMGTWTKGRSRRRGRRGWRTENESPTSTPPKEGSANEGTTLGEETKPGTARTTWRLAGCTRTTTTFHRKVRRGVRTRPRVDGRSGGFPRLRPRAPAFSPRRLPSSPPSRVWPVEPTKPPSRVCWDPEPSAASLRSKRRSRSRDRDTAATASSRGSASSATSRRSTNPSTAESRKPAGTHLASRRKPSRNS